MTKFTQRGEVMLDGFYASFPLAKLSGDAEALRLTCLGREYHFPRNCIRGLHRHHGWFSVGLRIVHTQEALPEFVLFWASVFFWTSGFEKLRMQLESLGYEVT